MAKVMISIPDDLLAEADRQVSSRGTTRSGYLQSLIQGDLEASDAASRAALGRILAMAEPRGGNIVELIKKNRPKH
ncbi:MAG: hypothetical protein HYX29_06195 [Solirubrobacterales bacterium]|nr:hypothetical protein [Solirubrobacterales bacterium]